MDMEDRVHQLEETSKKHEDRLDRHSKRIYAVEDGLAKKSEEIGEIRTEVVSLSTQMKAVEKNQEITNKKISAIDNKLDSHGKWLKFMCLAVGITLVVIFFKDSETAKSIVQILSILKATPLV